MFNLTTLSGKQNQSAMTAIIMVTIIIMMIFSIPKGAKAEVKDEVVATTFATTAATTNTVNLVLSGTIEKMFIKIPATDESVRLIFEDLETGYRFISATQTGSASAITTDEIDLGDVKFSGALILRIYCNRSTLGGNITKITGKIIYEE